MSVLDWLLDRSPMLCEFADVVARRIVTLDGAHDTLRDDYERDVETLDSKIIYEALRTDLLEKQVVAMAERQKFFEELIARHIANDCEFAVEWAVEQTGVEPKKPYTKAPVNKAAAKKKGGKRG